jgi:D-amino-acid oxidase
VDVVVLGAGIIGLAAALELQAHGAEVTIVAADEPGETVSAVAAAVWYPTRIDADPRVLGWGGLTFDVFAAEANRAPGVTMRPTRMIVRHPVDGPPWWASAVPDFTAVDGEWRFTVPAVEMVPYLAHLLDRFRAGGGVFERRRVDRFDELAAPVIVNATGLAARALTGDDRLYPIRGQVVIVENPGLTTSIRDEDHPLGPVYIHPRSRDVVLGGTFEVGDASEEIRPATAEAIIARTTQVEPRLAGATIRRHLVGLRPARHGGPRVEAEQRGHQRIIHAYGHSGAGMTLCWGTAAEVARLAG